MPKLTDLPDIDNKIRNKLRKAKITIEKLAKMSPEELQQILPNLDLQKIKNIIENAKKLVIAEVEKLKEIKNFQSTEELYKYLEKFYDLDLGTVIFTAQHPDNLKNSLNIPDHFSVVWISDVRTPQHITLSPRDKDTIIEFIEHLLAADNKIVAVDCITLLNENMPEKDVVEILTLLNKLHKERDKCVYIVIPSDLPEKTSNLYLKAFVEGEILQESPEVSASQPTEEKIEEKKEPTTIEESVKEEESIEIPDEAKVFLSLPHITAKDAILLHEKAITIEKLSILTPIELKDILPHLEENKLGEIIDAAKKILQEKSKKEVKEEPEKVEVVEFKPEKIDVITQVSLKIKRGFINGNGVVSTHGNLYITKRISEKKIWIKFVPAVVFLLLIVSFIPLYTIGTFLSTSLVIDGNFEDWNKIKGLRINNMTLKIYGNDRDVYFYVEKENLFRTFENILIGIDIDGCNRTGYETSEAGLDILASIYGSGGECQGSSINNFKKILDGYTLSPSKGLIYKFDEGKLEISIRSRNYSKNSKVIFVIKDKESYTVLPPLKIYDPNGILILSNNPSVIPNNYEVAISNISFLGQDSIIINYIKLRYSGGIIKNAMLVLEYTSFQGEITSEEILFTINKPFSRFEGSIRLIVEAPQTTVLKITDVVVNSTGNVLIINKLAGIYVDSAPSSPIVDGALGEWKNPIRDNSHDLSKDLFYYPNIDILSTESIYEHSSNRLYIFLETAGEFLGGDKIPVVKMIAPKDSDRDTIPDDIDPYPYDFNNDGEPDSLTPNDVDRDGERDYPYGNDVYLNTTIPDDPKFGNYSGREISIYIGPIVEKPIKGYDFWIIYVDTDSNPSTGYQGYEFKGAENKIEIIGKDGKIESITHYRWFGYWIFIDKPLIATTYSGCEIAVNLRIAHLYRIGIFAYNWMNYVDHILFGTSKVKSSSYAIQTFYLHEDSNVNDQAGYMDWTPGNNLWSKTLRPGYSYIYWIYRYKLCDDYEIRDAKLNIWIDPQLSGNLCTFSVNIKILKIGNINDPNTFYEIGSVQRSYSQSGDIPQRLETYTIQINETIIPRGYFIGVAIRWSDNENDDYLQVSYNTTYYNSSLVINTSSLIECRLVWTSPDSEFEVGENVEIYATVVDPLGPSHISHAILRIYDPFGQEILSTRMYKKDNIYESIFNYTFGLYNKYYWVGTYKIQVNAYDILNIEDYNFTAFYIKSNVSLEPINVTKFCGPTGGIVIVNHTIINSGGGYDRYNFEASINTPNFIQKIILDVNSNGIHDNNDLLLYENGVVYVDEDSDGRPDIRLFKSQKNNILIEIVINVKSKLNNVLYFTVISSLGARVTSFDNIILREVKIKDLYLRRNVTTGIRYLYPIAGTSIILDTGYTYYEWTSMPFANSVSLDRNICVKVWLREGEGRCDYARITIRLSLAGTIIFNETVTVRNAIEKKVISKTPTIREIPANERLVLRIEGLDSNQQPGRLVNVYYGDSATYPSKIEINTTSYIFIENISTYLISSGNIIPIEQYNFSAGDKLVIRARVRDPFGSYDIKYVNGFIISPNGTSSPSISFNRESDLGSVVVYHATYQIPYNSRVGRYVVRVIAAEFNDVSNTSSIYFIIKWNISIEPTLNSSTQTSNTFYFNHTLYNNGDGYDIINIVIVTNYSSHVELHINNSLAGIDYNGDGIWEICLLDTDKDNRPDTGWLPPGTAVRITIKIVVERSCTANIFVYSSMGSSAEATDIINVVPEVSITALFTISLLLMISLRRTRLCTKSRNS